MHFISNRRHRTVKAGILKNRLKLLAVAASAIGIRPSFGAESTAYWKSGVSGSWTTAADWSTPYYPNNGTPASSTYAAIINASGTYGVTLNSKNIAVDSLLLNDSGATLTLSNAYTLSSGSTTVSSGTLIVGNAVLAAAAVGSTLSVSGTGIMDVTEGTLKALTLTNGTTIGVSAGGGLTISGSLLCYGSATINGSGAV